VIDFGIVLYLTKNTKCLIIIFILVSLDLEIKSLLEARSCSMKISFDLSSMTVGGEFPNSIPVIFAVALRTLEKLGFEQCEYVEVIKISQTIPRDAPVPHTLGCVVWTCVLNLSGKKTEVKMLRSSFYGMLYESDDNSEALDLNHSEDYIERASEEFARLIEEAGRTIAESILQEAQTLCNNFDVEY
jgi:hypothetical protein